MKLVICDATQPSCHSIGAWAADYIEQRIQRFAPSKNRPFRLGLPTGSTPLSMYQQLTTKHQAGQLSFQHVVTFNLDEYVGLAPDHPQSYHHYMQKNFFQQIDLPTQNINLLDGNAIDLQRECDRYEAKIQAVGGLDLCIGGVGEEGHIAFNEAGATWNKPTHIEVLAESTRMANSRFFGNDPTQVPKQALTMGMGTILAAREVMILAQGPRKAIAVHQAIEGEPTPRWPISALQQHPRSLLVCDEAASQRLLNRNATAQISGD